ncbi:MAG: arginine--tRNA ligase [Candidatus Syntropharchaeia archaeon]
MFLEFKKEIELRLKDALNRLSFEYDDLRIEESEHADLSSSIAFGLAKKYHSPPKKIAEEIGKEIRIPDDTLISHVETVGPYINFFVNRSFLEKTLEKIRLEGKNYGSLSEKGKVIVEHTSANPNGPLHVGHIRNSIIGDTIARILRRAGFDVETQYYVNDMGRQIATVVWGTEKFGIKSEKKEDHEIAEVYIAANREIESNPDLKGKIDELLRLYEEGEEDTMKKFKKVVNLCLSGIKITLRRLKVNHDFFVWESEFVRSGEVKKLIERIKNCEQSKMEGGALLLDLRNFGFEKELVLQRSDGTSLYSTRDIAYHVWKGSRCNRMIDVLGADHKLISSQLASVLKILGFPAPEIVIFEFVSLPEGSMSTRAGKFVSADELIDEVVKGAYAEVDKRRKDEDEKFKREVSEIVGIGAIRYDIVKISPEKSMVFDWKDALDFEKQGAPFIQYAHARACSILKKAGYVPDEFDASLLTEEAEISLIKTLSRFQYVIKIASSSLRPNLVATYSRELALAFNVFYRDCPVLAVEDDLRGARLGLVDCSRIVLENSLDTLGIDAPEEM